MHFSLACKKKKKKWKRPRQLTSPKVATFKYKCFTSLRTQGWRFPIAWPKDMQFIVANLRLKVHNNDKKKRENEKQGRKPTKKREGEKKNRRSVTRKEKTRLENLK